MKPTEAEVLDALSGVRDPELDEPITDLKFISDLRVAEDAVMAEADGRHELCGQVCGELHAFVV